MYFITFVFAILILLLRFLHMQGPEGNKGIAAPLEATCIGGKGRGLVVNPNLDPSGDNSYVQFGDPSEIVVLEYFDPCQIKLSDLRQDVEEECNRYGFIQNIIIYPHDDNGLLRVFVQFTGAAGAYRAVRALDARFVAGRSIRCRYYPAEAFFSGQFVASQN